MLQSQLTWSQADCFGKPWTHRYQVDCDLEELRAEERPPAPLSYMVACCCMNNIDFCSLIKEEWQGQVHSSCQVLLRFFYKVNFVDFFWSLIRRILLHILTEPWIGKGKGMVDLHLGKEVLGGCTVPEERFAGCGRQCCWGAGDRVGSCPS